ncbi:hypothetical protein GCM10027456_26040 [Kineosporia babensis]
MTVTVCPRKCWACMLLQCPGGPHGWASDEDRLAARLVARDPDQSPADGPCGCPCVNEEPEEPEADESLSLDPCPVCESTTACGYDTDGRPLIHATPREADA